MIAQIYDKRNLKSLGQMNYFVLYLSFFLSSLIVDTLIKRFNKDNHSLKISMSISVLFYTLYQIGSAYTCWCTTPSEDPSKAEPLSLTCSHGFLLFVNIFCSFVIGFFGATMLWGVQFLYINKLAKFTSNSGLYFNIFYKKLQFNRLLGSIINFCFYLFYYNLSRRTASNKIPLGNAFSSPSPFQNVFLTESGSEDMDQENRLLETIEHKTV